MKKAILILSLLLLTCSYSCQDGNTQGNTITISLDDIVSVTADVTYIDSNCSFDSKQYVGTYSDVLQTFFFSAMNGCTDVSGSNVQLYTCSGDLTGSFNGATVTCSLEMSGELCICASASGSSEAQVSAAGEISTGIQTLIEKSINAKDSVFNNPDLCSEQLDASNPSYICPCSLL